MGLPKVLEDMLQAALNNSSLQSWNIFQDKDGAINFRLRFSGHQESVTHVPEASYKRKTNSQIQRDLQRSSQWKNRRNQSARQNNITVESSVLSTPQTDHPRQCATQKSDITRVKTRAMSKADPELVRAQEDEAHTPLNPFADSFIMPCETPEGSLSDTDTSKDLTPTLILDNNITSSTTHREQEEESDIIIPKTTQDDQASAVVSSKQLGACIPVRRRKDCKMCNFCGKGNTYQQCVKCKALICMDCVTKSDHHSHIDLYGYEDV